MTKTKSAKKAFFMSVISLLLCVTMLMGTTFAWFTDSVTSANNVIMSGNLDIELEYWNGEKWVDVNGSSDILTNQLWEPGVTEVVYLKLENEGSLALKYQLGVNIVEEKDGVNQADDPFKLSDYIYFDVVESAKFEEYASREDAMEVATYNNLISDGYSKTNNYCKPDDCLYLNMVVYMPTDVGNDANYKTSDDPADPDKYRPEIKLGIDVFATQTNYEEDSFGNDYDYDIPPIWVTSQKELADALTYAIDSPAVIMLSNDIELSGDWTPIGNKDEGKYFTGTLDGKGYTISGLNVVANDYDALISAAKDATIKNLTVEGTVNGVNAAGIVARVEGNSVIENCVSKVNVSGSTKAGGIVCNVTNADAVIKNCVNNADVTGAGTAGLGGIVGYVNNDATLNIFDCVNNGNVTGGSNQYAGAAIGYAAGTSTGSVVDFDNTGAITGKNSVGDSLGRWLEASDGTVLAAYCATPANWSVSYKMSSGTIAAMKETKDGTDITKKVGSVVFGKASDYPGIVNNNTPVSSENGVDVYQVPNGKVYDVYYLSESTIALPENSRYMFMDMSEVTEIDTSNLDMSQVENALCMFANCSKLEKLDTASWDVSNMTNMQSLFYGCKKLEEIDVSNWDTSNVTNMRMVFFRCNALPSKVLEGVENWDVSNVTNFYSMFKHAYGVTSLDLSKWDTSSAINMSHMFANIGDNLTTLDLSSFDTSKVTDMSWMFYSANNLTTIYVGDGWTTAALDPANPTCFYNNQKLVGGAGTTWLDVCDMANPARPWESSAKLDYAKVDGGATNPGLFTYKANS